MLISLTQVKATRNGTLEKEKRDHAVSQWTQILSLRSSVSSAKCGVVIGVEGFM